MLTIPRNEMKFNTKQRRQTGFGGRDLYPDLASKAAELGHSLIQNHPFVDGNNLSVMRQPMNLHRLAEQTFDDIGSIVIRNRIL